MNLPPALIAKIGDRYINLSLVLEVRFEQLPQLVQASVRYVGQADTTFHREEAEELRDILDDLAKSNKPALVTNKADADSHPAKPGK